MVRIAVSIGTVIVTLYMGTVSALIINDGAVTNINSDLGDQDLQIFNNGANPTTVNFVSGANVDRDVQVFDTSSFTMSDGSIGQALDLNDASSATVSGGTIGDGINVHGNSTLNLLDGYYGSEDMDFFGTSSIFMSGGNGESFNSNDSVNALITGGALESISADENAYVEVQSLSSLFDRVSARQSSTIQIFGGSFNFEDLVSEDTAVIDIYGLSFNLPFGPIAALSGQDLSGILLDGSAFFVSDYTRDRTAAIILHGPVTMPAPGVLLLMVTGLALLGVDKRGA